MSHIFWSARRTCIISLLIALACAGLLSAAAEAGASASPPAAVSFDLSIQTTVGSNPFNATATGVANQNGDTQATITYGGHSFGLIRVGGLSYQNEDGGAYQAAGGAAALASGAQSGFALTPSCLQAQSGLDTIFRQALAGQGAGADVGLQDLGRPR